MRLILAIWLGCLCNACNAQGLDQLPEAADSLPGPHLGYSPADDGEQELARFKRQALQSVSVTSGCVVDVSANELNSSFLQASIGSGIPLGSFDNILAITPGFRVDWIDASPRINVPSELYLFETQFFYRRPIRERLSVIGIFSPSIRSDLTTSDNAFRVFALGLLNWAFMEDYLVLSGGAVFLGRADLPVLPAVGLTWTPHRRAKLDLRFPESRFAYRFAKDGRFSEKWASLAIGIGGDTWAVSRKPEITDELSLRDIRITARIDKMLDGGGGWLIEGGFAFNRRLEYERQPSEISLGDAMIFQVGWRY